jgi:hypothetical protein
MTIRTYSSPESFKQVRLYPIEMHLAEKLRVHAAALHGPLVPRLLSPSV